MTYTEKQFLQKLRSDKYPAVAEEGKGYFVIWADGRGQVGYKNKKHAIAFIEQGDRDAVSMQYREREKGETVRNIFAPDKSTIHDMLLEEASTKREFRKKAAIHDLLFLEAESLRKESMATQSGGSTRRNSGWNNKIPISVPIQPSIPAPTGTIDNQWVMDFQPDLTPEEAEQQIIPKQEPIQPQREETPKPMPIHDPTLDYVGKDTKKRRLIKQRTGGPMGIASVEERLQKAANKLDECGENVVADKIDLLLTKLCEIDYVRKTSRV